MKKYLQILCFSSNLNNNTQRTCEIIYMLAVSYILLVPVLYFQLHFPVFFSFTILLVMSFSYEEINPIDSSPKRVSFTWYCLILNMQTIFIMLIH